MLIAFRPTRAQRRAADAIARILLFLAAAAMAAVGASLLLALMAGEAGAAEGVPMKPTEAQTGALFLKTAPGETRAVPLVTTDADIRVSGMVARARVRQVFRNPNDDWYEGVYVFPLPENAAVDRLRIRVGERVIEGVIKERQAPKRPTSRRRRPASAPRCSSRSGRTYSPRASPTSGRARRSRSNWSTSRRCAMTPAGTACVSRPWSGRDTSRDCPSLRRRRRAGRRRPIRCPTRRVSHRPSLDPPRV